MRFPYHQIDDDTIESAGNIQDSSSDRLSSGGASNDRHRNDDLEDLTTPSFRQLLPFWPFIIGIFQIVNGFLCAIFGVVIIMVVPFVINVEAELSLNQFNGYGAALWSGIMLVLSGSCAVRTAKVKSLGSVQLFYMVTLFSMMTNLAFLILILWCFMYMHGDVWQDFELQSDFDWMILECNKDNIPQDFTAFCDLYHKVQQCSTVNLVSAVCCLFGCLILFLSTINYCQHVFFGEVQLLKSLAVCWLPCWFYSVQYETLQKSEFYKRSTEITQS